MKTPYRNEPSTKPINPEEILKMPAALDSSDADKIIVLQNGIVKYVSLDVVKNYINNVDLLNKLDGDTAPTNTDDSSQGYSVGSFWIDIVSSPKEAYRCVDSTVDSAIWLNTTLEINELGTAALLDIATPTAENDILVGSPSPFGTWVKKTLVEFKTILGLFLSQTSESIGFTISGGTTSKTLTVPLDASVSGTNTGDQDLSGLLTKQMVENDPLLLDAALSADGKYSGIVEAGTIGTAALAFGESVYLASTGKWEKTKADAAATATGKLGMCVLAGASNEPTTILLFGKIRADAQFPSFTVGAPVYLSAAMAGVLTSTAPTGTTDFVVRCVGYANTADELFWNPSNDYITLA